MGTPFNSLASWLAQTPDPTRYEVAFVPADGFLAVDVYTVSNQPDVIEWLPVEWAKTNGEHVPLSTREGVFGITGNRQIVLREVAS